MSYLESSGAEPQALTRQVPPVAIPMRPPTTTRSYRGLFATFALHPGEWFAVLPEGITGQSLSDKRRNLLFAARVRGLRLQTSIQDGQLFAKLVVDAAVR
jgi:hypothetical protein